MNLTTHLVKTDIRRSRGLLLVWLLLLAIQGILVCKIPPERGAEGFPGMISHIMPQLEMLFLFVFVPFVVLGDPLVGTTGFWLTRPISRATLLKSKALFVVAVIVLPAVLVEIAVFAINGVTLRDTGLVVVQVIVAILVQAMIVTVVAGLTPSFARYAIVGVAIVVALLAMEIVVSSMQIQAAPSLSFSLGRSKAVAVSALIILGGGAVVAHQYLTRRTVRSIAAAAVIGIAVLCMQHLWGWDFMAPAPLQNGGSPLDVSAVKIELEKNLFAQEIATANGQGAPDKQLDGAIDAGGLPLSYPVRPKRIRAHLQLADGTLLPVKEAYCGALTMQMHAEALEFGIGGIPVVNAADPTYSMALFVLDAATYGKYQDQPLTLSADIDCVASKYAVTAEMPVVKGARSHRGSRRLEITGVLRQSDGVDIALRETEPNLLFDGANEFRPEYNAGPGSRFFYLLRNMKRHEAVLQKRAGFTFYPYTPFGESRLVNRSSLLSFGPEPQNNRLTPTLDAAWLAEAELVRIDLVPMQEFSARLVAEKLKLNGKNVFKPRDAEARRTPAPVPKIELPPNASKDQVKEYINAVLITGQRQKKFKADDPQVGMLVKVGPQNLDALLEIRSTLGCRHTLDWYAGETLDDYLDAAIKQLARPEDKDLIIQALPSDHNLAEVVLEKGFQADARETLLAELSHKEAGLPPSWIKAVAALGKTPLLIPS